MSALRCIILYWAILFNTSVFSQPPHLNPLALAALKNIASAKFSQHLTFLGSDLLAGRGTGTRGGDIAAAYIAGDLAKLNIQPAGDDHSYYQQIPMHGSRPLPGSNFQIISKHSEKRLELGKDYLLYNTGAQTFVPKPVPLEGPDYRHTSRAAGAQRLIKWGQQIYHTPADDLQQPINLAAAQQHTQVLFALCLALANSTNAPQWRKGVPYLAARLQSIAEKR